MTLVGAILAAFVFAYTATSQTASATGVGEQRFAEAQRALSQMEQAIRLSERVLEASDALMILETRYFWDSDDDVELIRYTLVGDQLLRAVADGSAVYDSDEVVAENISFFSCHSLEISDEFDRVNYDTSDHAVMPPTGDMGTVDLDATTVAVFEVHDFATMDADLPAAYDADNQRLEIENNSAVAAKTVTVSPPTPAQGLQAITGFTPIEDNMEYRPIVFGSETLDVDNVAVVFEPDRTIRVKSVRSGTLMGQAVGTTTWEPLQSYSVKLELRYGRAYAWVDAGNGYEVIGDITGGNVDDKPVHLQAVGNGARGAWDSLRITYPYVQLELQVHLTDGPSLSLYGGATRRQRVQ